MKLLLFFIHHLKILLQLFIIVLFLTNGFDHSLFSSWHLNYFLNAKLKSNNWYYKTFIHLYFSFISFHLSVCHSNILFQTFKLYYSSYLQKCPSKSDPTRQKIITSEKVYFTKVYFRHVVRFQREQFIDHSYNISYKTRLFNYYFAKHAHIINGIMYKACESSD